MTEMLDEPRDEPRDERCAEARKKRKPDQPAANRAATEGLERLLDYAIVEGAELRRPLFVFLLRLARLALLEEDGAYRRPPPSTEEGETCPTASEQEGASRPDTKFVTTHEER